jgi:hypothetical protein
MKKCIATFLLFTTICSANTSAITFEKGGGRFGDQLVSYLHALWMNYRTGLPILLPEIDLCDQLQLSTKHPRILDKTMAVRNISSNANFYQIAKRNTLYYIPYFPDFSYEAAYQWDAYIVIDWEDPHFLALVRENLSPKNELPKLSLPENRVSVAMHVRRGGGYDDPHGERMDVIWPMKFPPDQFYFDSLRQIDALLDHPPLHIHIFTDAIDPSEIALRYREALSDLDVTFSFREEGNRYNQNILEDFFAMLQFDCLIYPLSNFSYIPSRIGNYKVRIAPRRAEKIDGIPAITGVQIETNI